MFIFIAVKTMLTLTPCHTLTKIYSFFNNLLYSVDLNFLHFFYHFNFETPSFFIFFIDNLNTALITNKFFNLYLNLSLDF